MDDRLGNSENDGLKAVATALVDLKTCNQGHSCFKWQNNEEICACQDNILSRTPGTTHIGAYQTSLKELWDKADQDHREKEVLGESRDMHECILTLLSALCSLLSVLLPPHIPILPSRNQASLPRPLYKSLRGLCRVGGLSNLELVAFFAHRDRSGQIDMDMRSSRTSMAFLSSLYWTWRRMHQALCAEWYKCTSSIYGVSEMEGQLVHFLTLIAVEFCCISDGHEIPWDKLTSRPA